MQCIVVAFPRAFLQRSKASHSVFSRLPAVGGFSADARSTMLMTSSPQADVLEPATSRVAVGRAAAH